MPYRYLLSLKILKGEALQLIVKEDKRKAFINDLIFGTLF